MDNIFSKFKVGKEKNKYGEYEYKTTDTQKHRFTRQFYNVKGQVIFKFRVISYHKTKNTLVRNYTSLQEIVIDRPALESNIKKVIYNAKIQAIYAHYAEKGDRDLINDTDRLKKEIIKIDIVDYMVYYDKGYNKRLSKPRLIFEKDMDNSVVAKLYDEKSGKYEIYNKTSVKERKGYEEMILDERVKQEKNYTLLY